LVVSVLWISGSDERVLGRDFVEGGPRENRPPRGVEKNMLIFEKECFRKIAARKRRICEGVVLARKEA